MDGCIFHGFGRLVALYCGITVICFLCCKPTEPPDVKNVPFCLYANSECRRSAYWKPLSGLENTQIKKTQNPKRKLNIRVCRSSRFAAIAAAF